MASTISLEYYNRNQAALSVYNDTGSLISVISGGTLIPLAKTSYLNGFTRASDTQFTVNRTGVYYISYSAQVTIALSMSAGIYRNNAVIPGLVKRVTVSLTSLTAVFAASAVTALSAGDQIDLRLYGVLGSATLTGGVGAYVNVIKIA